MQGGNCSVGRSSIFLWDPRAASLAQHLPLQQSWVRPSETNKLLAEDGTTTGSCARQGGLTPSLSTPITPGELQEVLGRPLGAEVFKVLGESRCGSSILFQTTRERAPQSVLSAAARIAAETENKPNKNINLCVPLAPRAAGTPGSLGSAPAKPLASLQQPTAAQGSGEGRKKL